MQLENFGIKDPQQFWFDFVDFLVANQAADARSDALAEASKKRRDAAEARKKATATNHDNDKKRSAPADP